MNERPAQSAAEPTTVEEVYALLLARAPENKMEPRLAPLYRAMDVLGEPNRAFPIIHITGTNGKTSTARMIEAGLRAHGLRTGRYTSPHLARVTERISLDGAPVPDATFVRIWNEITPYLAIVDAELVAAGEPRLTYFECVTILGFAAFADEPVDVAVIEVGLGGITDATNVGDGAVSVVTPISLDHTDLLGDTVEDIAREKAGIIKRGGFLVSAAQPRGAAQVLLEKAREVGVPHRFEGVEFGVESRSLAVGGQVVTVQGLAGRYEDLVVPLHGAHQAENAAVAVAALEAFLGGGERELSVEVLREGFAEVSSPGRLETVRTSPTIIVDAAHNPDGIRVSAQALKEAFDFSTLVIVLGVLREKDAEEILRTLEEEFADERVEYCFTQSASPRAIPAEELAEMALDLGFDEDAVHVEEKLDDAIAYAVERADATEDFAGGVLITGSITVVGEARTLLGKDAS
ncbi:folylpolyglutamate synthase/dihydrofolate synthase family protein [Sinomonas atrocyanea]|uniref:bifunctional folylpolyglutamate synthase/dihydrofolate synthase n=1 Tax=Sinomonas atrocyanea TaxID=37927 RepID=UPI002782D353|nr:folylpolyglutamate synthase/dihydrofolate synthase family protein [Sinomonas atrocyanea]MDQ0261672.1 dihydrofolate synthase/folylpolyglutamate synthase [Sinomonas atrocyanea]MDR6622714.1 dihydrofolate synthase/folylpolyglutamate synthase [Sinomonas atrocyanea]